MCAAHAARVGTAPLATDGSNSGASRAEACATELLVSLFTVLVPLLTLQVGREAVLQPQVSYLTTGTRPADGAPTSRGGL